VTSLAVVTPTYAPDFELFRDLHRSVLAFTDPSVVHYAVTPSRDLARFAELAGPRLVVWPEADVLPRHLVAVPGTNAWINLRRPFPPIRGWVLQQIIKLAVTARMAADVVLLVDSDVLLVRPVDASTLVADGRARFYRRPRAVDGELPRHLGWHGTSRRLLGLPVRPPPLPDYVTSFNIWDPRIVRQLQLHVARSTGGHWADPLAAQLHFSEWTLYGVFVDDVLGEPANGNASDATLCHSYWDPTPLDEPAADAFVSRLPDGDLAIMISAKSRTPLHVRRSALAPVMVPPA
jgi:hypothetical protein